MSKKINPCPSCGLKRSPDASLCPKCDKASLIDKCKAGFDALTIMPAGKQVLFILLAIFCIVFLPLVFIIFMFPSDAGMTSQELESYVLDSPSTVVSMLFSQITAVALFLIICRKYLASVFAKSLNRKAILVAVVTAVIALAVNYGWNMLIEALNVGVNENQETATQLIGTSPFVSFFQVVLGAAFAEEIAFRAGVFSLLSRKNKILAYIGSAVFFAVVHLNLTGAISAQELMSLPLYIFLGVVLAYVYDKYGLLASVITHAINNLLGWMVAYIF